MDARTAGPSSVKPTRVFRVRLFLACAALLVLLPAAARGDDMIMGNFGGILLVFGLAVVTAVAAVAAFMAAACLVEGYVMNLFLKLGYRRCFWYAVVANLVSSGLGLIWYYAGGQVGWKTAMIHGQFGTVALLMARSFVITVAEETVVIVLLLRKERGFEAAFKAVAAMNAASYAILGVILSLVGLVSHPVINP